MFAKSLIIFSILPTCLLAAFCKNIGLDRDNNYYEYEVCCPGYRETFPNEERECEAICDEGCDNGTCIDPNHCKCHEGFSNIDNNVNLGCIPDCPKGCRNGECVAPGKCQCETDFQLDLTSGVCTPICSNGCPNGSCSSPGHCICNAGFWQAQNQSCYPTCEPECLEDRFCAAPNKCSCRAGYVEENNLCVIPGNIHTIPSASTTSIDNNWLLIRKIVVFFLCNKFFMDFK